MKTLSVVTVTYNCEQFIEKTLLSIIPFVGNDVELIIIDGGSKDGTLDVIKKYSDFAKIIVSEKDLGPYDAMNKGASFAEGKFLSFMNAGDWFHYEALTKILPILKETSAGLVFGDVELFLNDIQIGIKPATIYGPEKLPAVMPFCHQSCFITNEVFRTLEGFNISYKILADYDLIMRHLISPKFSCHKVSFPVACFSLGGKSSDAWLASNERFLIHRRMKINLGIALKECVKWKLSGFIRNMLGASLEIYIRKMRLKISRIL